MIPWQPTCHDRIQVRPSYGVIPVSSPGLQVVGWEVRVWYPKRTAPPFRMCNLCGRTVEARLISLAAAKKRLDFEHLSLSAHGCEFRIAPYAHKCSSPVPWRADDVHAEGWRQPHRHPIPAYVDEAMTIKEHVDERATPVLYANAQLAYAAGLALLGIDKPARMHWSPAA